MFESERFIHLNLHQMQKETPNVSNNQLLMKKFHGKENVVLGPVNPFCSKFRGKLVP